jgi:hypothetical protein
MGVSLSHDFFARMCEILRFCKQTQADDTENACDTFVRKFRKILRNFREREGLSWLFSAVWWGGVFSEMSGIRQNKQTP